jgi:mutator protein MutT
MKDTHPGKALKFCPFCGSKPFVWDNKKSHHCIACKRRLYTNAAGAVVALIENQQHEILFTLRKFDPAKGKLDLPGGFIDLGEKAEDAVVREVKEELNLEVNAITFFGTFPNTYTFNHYTYFTIDMVFRCSILNVKQIQANDDVADFRFVHPKHVNLDDIGLDSIKHLVGLLQQQQDY